jgi:hypothetical protein
MLGPIVAFAQNERSTGDDLQACTTNAGSPGILFRRHFNTVVAPEVFDSIQLTASDGSSYTNSISSAADIILFPDVRFENQIEVFSMPRAKTDQRTVIEFRDSSGEIVQSCFVVVVEYDASIHDVSETAVGYCDFGGSNGVSNLKVGEVRMFDLPEKYREGAISPPSVVDYKPERGARQVTFTSHSAGFATFVWLGIDTGKGSLKGVCPIIVWD